MMEHNHTQEWMLEVRRNKALTQIVNAAKLQQDGTLVNQDDEVEADQADADADAAEVETDQA
ncbi:Uncharacterised protein [Mycobacteroides abscessus subsp. abscessus]|nr:Uncharacterised protein [Mycobacteroides abscessus subsp. abscessus]